MLDMAFSLPLSGILLIISITGSLIYYLFISIVSYRRLSHIPGPKANALSIFPLLYAHWRGTIDVQFGEWNKRYGVLVRIAPNTLLTSDPEVWRRMSAPRSPYRRSNWYSAMRLNPGVDNIISTRDEKRHDELRRRMALGYAGKENVMLEKDIDDSVLDLSNLIASKYLSSGGQVKPMDFARKIQFFTSDIMSKLSVDAKFYDLRDDTDNLGYIHDVETSFPFMFCFSVIPTFVELLTKIGVMGLMAPKANSKLGFGTVLGIARKQVQKRFDEEGKIVDKKDMLGSFLRHGLTRDEAEAESVMQLYLLVIPPVRTLQRLILCTGSLARIHPRLAFVQLCLTSYRILGCMRSSRPKSTQQWHLERFPRPRRLSSQTHRPRNCRICKLASKRSRAP